MLGIWIGLGLNFWLPPLFRGATITWHRSLLFFTGITLMLSGVALRWYAIHVLGRYFTQEVAIRPDQPVIQSGPYRYIRHPSYSGTLMTMLGIGLAMTNWASLMAIMACTLFGHSYRIAVEEHALREKLGQPYIDYMRRTRRFIPFVY
jgi:protein-S-isoprenylcysteine O-methyltransferase Ste14